MASEMQERVARAIYEGRNGRKCVPWARQPEAHKEPYRADALAAMEAMREPTQEMIGVGQRAWMDDYGGDDAISEEIWTAMLDAEIEAAKKGSQS